MANMRIVVAVNRSSKPIEIQFDGIPYVFKPGENHVPYVVAEMARRRSPVMGTEDPLNPAECEYLIAVPEWGQDDSPIEQADPRLVKERLNRSMLEPDRRNVVNVIAPGLGPLVESIETGKASPRLRTLSTPGAPNDPRVMVIETDPAGSV